MSNLMQPKVVINNYIDIVQYRNETSDTPNNKLVSGSPGIN